MVTILKIYRLVPYSSEMVERVTVPFCLLVLFYMLTSGCIWHYQTQVIFCGLARLLARELLMLALREMGLMCWHPQTAALAKGRSEAENTLQTHAVH